MHLSRNTDGINEFIRDACKADGNVLVHCDQGVSRSATAVLAYLMKEHGMSLSEAFSLLQSKRGMVDPNYGFMQKLEDLERQLMLVD
jgi:protein-tyrosine phosphatase